MKITKSDILDLILDLKCSGCEYAHYENDMAYPGGFDGEEDCGCTKDLYDIERHVRDTHLTDLIKEYARFLGVDE